MARMALSAMQWQDTAQRQGLEITRSMMQGFPGQQFTESMMRSYLQGLEAVTPEMERAMEKVCRRPRSLRWARVSGASPISSSGADSKRAGWNVSNRASRPASRWADG